MKSTLSRCAKNSNFCHAVGMSGTSNNDLDKLLSCANNYSAMIDSSLYLEQGVATGNHRLKKRNPQVLKRSVLDMK